MKDTINGLNAADNNSHSKTPQHVSYLCSFYTVFYLVILQTVYVQSFSLKEREDTKSLYFNLHLLPIFLYPRVYYIKINGNCNLNKFKV